MIIDPSDMFTTNLLVLDLDECLIVDIEREVRKVHDEQDTYVRRYRVKQLEQYCRIKHIHITEFEFAHQ